MKGGIEKVRKKWGRGEKKETRKRFGTKKNG